MGQNAMVYGWDTSTPVNGQNGTWRRLQIDATGALVVSGVVASSGAGATTGIQTSVASTTSAQTILASNANRYGATITNDDVNTLYLLVASAGTVSSSVYTVAVAGGGGFYELPMMANGKPYTGIITGIWSADGSGSARVTEYVA